MNLIGESTMETKKPYKIRIIVPANTTAFNQRIKDAVKPVIPDDFSVDVKNIDQGNDCIENRYNLTENALAVVNLAKKTEEEGFNGIFVTDFDMCGVEASREVVDIPVIGGFRASAFTAMMLSQKFSIITILGSTVAMQLEHIKTFGLENNFASIRSINCPVQDLQDADKVSKLVFEACCEAISQDGSQSFILGCTGFIGIAERVSMMLTQELGYFVPITDPNRVAIDFLVLLVRNKLSQSRICYNKVDL